MPSYTRTTFASLRTQLASRLNDTNKVSTTDAELKIHIWNSLRFWNCLTGEFRSWNLVNVTNPAPAGVTVPSSVWYDLMDSSTMPSSPILPTVEDSDIYSWLQYALLEPQSGIPLSLLTAQFEVNDFVEAVQNIRDQFLLKTGIISNVRALNVTPNTNPVALPETVIQARRAYWLPAGGKGNPNPLLRIDERQIAGWGTDLLTGAGDPGFFSAGVEPPLRLSLYPAPGNAGQIEVITQESQALLSPTASTLLYVPTDYSAAIYWGALGQLLSMSLEAKDEARSSYCMDRYQQFVDLANLSSPVLAARIGNVTLMVDAVETLDSYTSNWRTVLVNGNPVQPLIVGLSGRNLFAFPTPAAAQLSLLLVTNAPLPVADADPVQVGDEVVEVILNYAQHTASFKLGSNEVNETIPLMKSMVELAALRNAKIRALSSFRDILYGTGVREDQLSPTDKPNYAATETNG